MTKKSRIRRRGFFQARMGYVLLRSRSFSRSSRSFFFFHFFLGFFRFFGFFLGFLHRSLFFFLHVSSRSGGRSRSRLSSANDTSERNGNESSNDSRQNLFHFSFLRVKL